MEEGGQRVAGQHRHRAAPDHHTGGEQVHEHHGVRAFEQDRAEDEPHAAQKAGD